jgi:ribosomal protein S18 acetylase RimI-like enzyme
MTPLQEIHIRQAVPADAPEIHALVQKAMAVYARNSGITAPLESQLETLEEHIAHILADHVLVAERHGHLIGSVRLVHGEDDTAYFSRFAVSPSLQRSGVGKQLYLAAEAWLKSRGVRSVRLHTALTNQPLVDFYIARGFRLIQENTARGYPRGTFQKDL